jgi:hypothetical protein
MLSPPRGSEPTVCLLTQNLGLLKPLINIWPVDAIVKRRELEITIWNSPQWVIGARDKIIPGVHPVPVFLLLRCKLILHFVDGGSPTDNNTDSM